MDAAISLYDFAAAEDILVPVDILEVVLDVVEEEIEIVPPLFLLLLRGVGWVFGTELLMGETFPPFFVLLWWPGFLLDLDLVFILMKQVQCDPEKHNGRNTAFWRGSWVW